MAGYTPDISRVQENLRYSYQKDHVDNFFDSKVDALWAHIQEEKQQDVGGVGFVVQVVSRGSIKSNPTYSLATEGGATRTQFVLPAINQEWKTAWTRDEYIAAGEGGKGTEGQFNLAKESMDQAMYFAKLELGKVAGGDGWGTLAGIGSISGSTVTLSHPDGSSTAAVPALTNRFYDGQIICAADVASSGDLRGTTPGDSLTVAAGGVNLTTGVITFTAALSTVAFAAGDYLSEKGYRNFSASSGMITLAGVEAWLPVDVVTDTFGGKSRSGRPDLQPYRFDASTVANSTVEQQFIRADEFGVTNGLKQEGLAIFTSPKTFRELVEGAVQKQVVPLTVNREGGKGTYTIGYTAFILNAQTGSIEIIPSSFIRPGIAFWGPWKSKKMGFKLKYAGSMLMNINDIDGLVFRSADVTDPTGNTVDGFRAKGYFRGQMTCSHPGNYLVIKNLADTSVG